MSFRYMTITAIALSILVVVGAAQLRGSGDSPTQQAAPAVNSVPTAEVQPDAALVSNTGIDRTSVLTTTEPVVHTNTTPVSTKAPVEIENREDRDHDEDDYENEEHDEDDD